MMLQVIVYAMGTAAALAVAGVCCERAALLRGRSLRFIWVLVLAGSIGGPLAAILLATARAAETPVVTVRMPDLANPEHETQWVAAPENTAEATDVGMAAAPRVPRIDSADPIRTLSDGERKVIAHEGSTWIAKLPSDRALLIAWAAVSGALWSYLLLASLLLSHRAAFLRRTTVQGQELLVSETTGPALLGTFRPQVVVPRWFFDEAPAAQALILAHEQQHRVARDPLLLRVALVAVAAVPWNLPLWWQLRRLRLAIELDCDARVMRGGVEADDYGGVLLAVTRRALNPPPGAAVAMAGPVSALELRIDRLVRAPVKRAGVQTAGALLLALVLVGAAIALEAPTLPSQPAATQTADQRPYTMPVPPFEPRAGMSFIQIALERYPEIAEGRDETGTYVVLLVLNADGSVQSSQMRFVASDQVMLAADEMGREVPPDASGGMTTGFGPGRSIPSGGTLRNDLRVTRYMLPADYDASRSLRHVLDAVERKHASLLRHRTDNLHYKVTVMMTDDGRIERDHVEEMRREELRLKLPEVAQAGDFAVLGVAPEALGRMGVRILAKPIPGAPPIPLEAPGGQVQLMPPDPEMLFVVYAWPRRDGEALSAQDEPPSAVSAPGEVADALFLPTARALRPQLSRGDVAVESRRLSDRVLEALLERYPEIVNGPNQDGWYTAAVTLRPDGSIYRSGLRFAASSEQSNQQTQELSSVLVPMQQSAFEMLIKGERLASGVVLPNALRYLFNVLPTGFDESRHEQLVREAVMARHADLLLPASAGVINRVTVFMTDDGRIDREHVDFGRTDNIARSTGRPEDFDFSVLGLRADQIGVFGTTQHIQMDMPVDLTNSVAGPDRMRRIIIRYAWPRREGEPMGGFPRAFDDVSPQQLARQQAAEQQVRAAELIARHFPALMADPASNASARPWLLLSSQGEVLRTGQSTLEPDELFIAATQLGPQMPGAQFAEVEFFSARGAGNRPVSVAFVWLAANSPVPVSLAP